VQSVKSNSGPAESPALFWKKSLKIRSSLRVLQALRSPGERRFLTVHRNQAAQRISEPSVSTSERERLNVGFKVMQISIVKLGY
jgi:hypothetical protein